MQRLTACGLMLICAGFGGCSTTQPWQRETLARRDLQLGGDEQLRAGEDHARSYREGSSGNGAAKGGGCGCN